MIRNVFCFKLFILASLCLTVSFTTRKVEIPSSLFFFFYQCVLISLLSSAVYQADPVREAGSGLQDCGHGAGGSNRSPPRQQEKVPTSNQAGSDAGQSADPDDADAEAAGRRLRRPQPQVTRTPCESKCIIYCVGWILAMIKCKINVENLLGVICWENCFLGVHFEPFTLTFVSVYCLFY